MNISGIEVNILVKNRPIKQYYHDNQVFVEGRADSNYEIEVRSFHPTRIEAVISVDGLSVVDAKPAGASSRGYLIAPFGKITIPGWMVDPARAAKFAFASRQESYASLMSDGIPPNNGVIGVMVFAEKKPVYHDAWRSFSPLRTADRSAGWGIGGYSQSSYSTAKCASAMPLMSNTSVTAATTMAAPSLGTAFGDATAFHTTNVAFERGERLTIVSIFYDNIAGLRARGVPVHRRRKAVERQPVAFPALEAGHGGCPPPPGW